ncbi:hypothetical protein [Georgenia sp. AZ-5]|uniref:hypothetical protein n=1 Tax=Georgenia sp. AZ-5 TaxID=3367526 RepID=UPI00375465B1
MDMTRLYELEQRFAALEPQLENSPVEESLSVMHAITGEILSLAAVGDDAPPRPDVAELFYVDGEWLMAPSVGRLRAALVRHGAW